MNPTIVRRFPLIARPRPVCTPLTVRVAEVRERAALARDTGDLGGATAVFNLSALLASDCGLPDLARTWCHRLAGAALDNISDPRHGLEPVVNLARLHVRAGNGAAAWALLETLFRAIDTRTDTVIDGLTIRASRITDVSGTHARVRSWLWKVLRAPALTLWPSMDDGTKRAAGLANTKASAIACSTAGRSPSSPTP